MCLDVHLLSIDSGGIRGIIPTVALVKLEKTTGKLTRDIFSFGMPWYFVRDNPRNSGCTGRLGIVDCTTASAAAPTYFEPWTIAEAKQPPPHCETVGTLVDGAVSVTGNPVYQACIEAFDFSEGYTPAKTITVSLGTGRFKHRKEPRWIGAWLEWILAELLESPGEQQTEITHRQFPEMIFYRIDTELKENIGLDDSRKIGRLLEYGERLAELIDWEAILAGMETRFRIGSKNTLWEQHKA